MLDSAVTSASPGPACSPPSGAVPPSSADSSDTTSSPDLTNLGGAVEQLTVLHPTLLAAVLAFNDAMLASWFATQPASIDALSVRERTHALAILSGAVPVRVVLNTEQIRNRHSRDARIPAVAAYVRACLVSGDHQSARRRAAVDAARIRIAAARAAAEMAEAVDVLADAPKPEVTLALGESVVLDGRTYRPVAIEGRTYHLLGPHRGVATLTAPAPEVSPISPMVNLWSAWFGKRGRNSRLRHYTRHVDGRFVQVGR